MADPLSIAASALSFVEVCGSVVAFLIKVKQGSDVIDADLDTLIAEVRSLESVSKLIHASFQHEISGKGTASGTEGDATQGLWRSTSDALKNSKNTLNELETTIGKVKGGDESSTIDRVRRYLRKLSKEGRIQSLRQRLDKDHNLLQVLLTAINITVARQGQTSTDQSFADLKSEIQALSGQLQTQTATLTQTAKIDIKIDLPDLEAYESRVKKILSAVGSIQKIAEQPNVHFMIPQSVRTNFTGRRKQLDELKHAYGTSIVVNSSKKFVVYGMGGTGKTQFCSKFAQENRKDFWGIFYIDATTTASAKSSYADLAEIAGTQANELSVKNWLQTQKKPWLLIVDNVDERPDAPPPENYFPENEAGLVLLTTRNHALRTLGNLGAGSYSFSGLEEDESTDLLLTSSGHQSPFIADAVQAAKVIAEAMGRLPLALVQTGKAIIMGQCTLQTCLSFFERSWSRVRSTRVLQSGQSSRAKSETTVYATFDMLYEAASPDALELLRLLSFMHRQRFRLEILVQAVLNPRLWRVAERAAQSKKSWKQIRQDLALLLRFLPMSLGECTILPKLIIELAGEGRTAVEMRLKSALSELWSMSLVDYVAEEECYSMHPLIHWWVRESMAIGEQWVWCQSAFQILSQAILLPVYPPLGTGASDQALRRHSLQHIVHARQQDTRIRKHIEENLSPRKRSWVPEIAESWLRSLDAYLQPAMRRSDIQRYAKFGLVYMENGEFDAAKDLFLVVDRFLHDNIGLGHAVAARARLALSEAVRWSKDEDHRETEDEDSDTQSEDELGPQRRVDAAEKAVILQEELLQACKTSLGTHNTVTLDVMDKLSMSLWQRGRFQDARMHQELSLKYRKKISRSGDTATFMATTQLGLIMGKLAEFEKAVKLHEKALKGLQKDQLRRVYDKEVLDVMENLAMARYDRHRYANSSQEDILEAESLEVNVVAHREQTIGKEHPFTLWAFCNLARIKGALGRVEEAERIFRLRLPIAERNLGESHIGTLFGKMFFGHTLMLANKLSEAEEILRYVVDEHDKAREGHPDQLVAAAFLLECYQRQGMHAKAEPLHQRVVNGTREVFGPDSFWEKWFTRTYSDEVKLGAARHDSWRD